MTDAAPAPGHVRVFISLDSATAIKNPEVLTKGDWTFRVFTGGVERWRSEREVHIGQGDTEPVAAAFQVEVPAESDHIDLRVVAAEKDILSGDDLAEGRTMLYRSQGFGSDAPFHLDLKGEDAHLRLNFSAKIESA